MNVTIIHTTPATIESLSQLAAREIPGVQLCNILDDSLLRDMVAGRDPQAVKERWIAYARIAEKNGAQAILSACSTVGEFAQEADRLLGVPVYRIDEAMARAAVARGGRIAVLATLPSTLGPTERLIRQIAAEQGAGCEITPCLVEGAYDALMGGDRAEHDRRIAQEIARCADHAESVVLAQASMASAAEALPQQTRSKLLTSPLLGIQKLRDDLRGSEG